MKKLEDKRLNLKKKLLARERIFAAWSSFFQPSIAEMFAHSGVDFIGLDKEHSTISLEQSQQIILACQASGTLCLPRIASHNMEMTKRLLESGADGIIVPMVSTREEVDRIVSWIKYPPKGRRSYGVARCHGYGFDFAEYTSSWNSVSSFIVQIESVEGVRNIDSILSCEDVDGAMIGPYDLSGSLGIPGRLEDPAVIEAGNTVIAACRRYRKSCGTHMVEPSIDSIEQAFDQGYTFVVLASDLFVLWKWCEQASKWIRKGAASKE